MGCTYNIEHLFPEDTRCIRNVPLKHSWVPMPLSLPWSPTAHHPHPRVHLVSAPSHLDKIATRLMSQACPPTATCRVSAYVKPCAFHEGGAFQCVHTHPAHTQTLSPVRTLIRGQEYSASVFAQCEKRCTVMLEWIDTTPAINVYSSVTYRAWDPDKWFLFNVTIVVPDTRNYQLKISVGSTITTYKLGNFEFLAWYALW